MTMNSGIVSPIHFAFIVLASISQVASCSILEEIYDEVIKRLRFTIYSHSADLSTSLGFYHKKRLSGRPILIEMGLA